MPWRIEEKKSATANGQPGNFSKPLGNFTVELGFEKLFSGGDLPREQMVGAGIFSPEANEMVAFDIADGLLRRKICTSVSRSPNKQPQRL